MKFVIQRVTESSVKVDDKIIGQIGKGFMVLIGVGQEDTKEIADKLIKKMIGLRIFEDENGKTNDLREIDWTNCVKNPHIYTIQDWEKLNESKKFFARKFDINKDPDVIFKIYNQLKID